MARPRLVPSEDKMKSYLERGLTHEEIVDVWESESGTRVSRPAISMAISRYELESAHDRPRYEDVLPWRVSSDHLTHYDARMLRLEGRRRSGGDLNDDELGRLTRWMQRLDKAGAVIHYDPDTEQGFWWVQREDTDDDIIRRPTKRRTIK